MELVQGLRDAYKLLDKLQYELWNESADTVWRFVLHARNHVDEELRKVLFD